MNNLVLLGVCNTCNNHFFPSCAKNRILILLTLDFPGSHSCKESTCQFRRCKRLGFNPGSGRSLGEEGGNPLQ